MMSLRMSVLRNAGLALLLAIQIAVVHGEVVVNDITQLNPIAAQDVIEPTSIEEIVTAVKSHAGPISIGGGRYSMGGQTATEGALQIDMRKFDKVISFSAENKEITVQAGITWRKIQEYIDRYNLSLQIMQTYANFTVGGALSVNAHGRYIGKGPLVLSVKSIRVVLADGAMMQASPAENSELFYGAIGGYGALGVIAEVTLMLTDNVRVERRSEVMPLKDYREFFAENVRNNSDVVFHNADIYPNAFDTVRVTSYLKTDKPVTVTDRLIPKDKSYRLDRWAYSIISEWPGGKWIRQHVIDPMLFHGERVEWRNYEASYDVRELEPSSREQSTYVLQEYFVPVDKLEPFVARMKEILNGHAVNTINISIRHAKPDPGTLMAWARQEVFAYVLYYKQGTSPSERRAVGVWTRELIEAATKFGGAYYLPYQIWASDRQFHAAYPNADKFFELKRKLDPDYKFRNKLWDAYYQPQTAPTSTPLSVAEVAAKLKMVAGYQRDEAQTFLTLPEWVLVYSPDEYARYLRGQPHPSGYPYFGSIGQFWGYYRDAYNATREHYPFNWGYHVMVFVIGSSFTAENAIKGLYENTVGRISEWVADNTVTAEDRFAASVAQDYVDFIRVHPWYEYSFATQLRKLWRDTKITGAHPLRKLERRLFLSVEYLAKAQYAMVIKLATKVAYGDADSEMLVLADGATPKALENAHEVQVVERFGGSLALLSLPRYEEFRDSVTYLSEQGVRFKEIAGNQKILLTSVVPNEWKNDLPGTEVVLSRPILTSPGRQRIGVLASVPTLHQVLLRMQAENLPVEHVYDY